MDLRFHVVDILKQKGHEITVDKSEGTCEMETPKQKGADCLLAMLCQNSDDIKEFDLSNAKVREVFYRRLKELNLEKEDFKNIPEGDRLFVLKLITNDRLFKSFSLYHTYLKKSTQLESILKQRKDYGIELERCDVNKLLLIKQVADSVGIDNIFKWDIKEMIKKGGDELNDICPIQGMAEIRRVFRFKKKVSNKCLDGRKLLMTMITSVWGDLTVADKVWGSDVNHRCKVFAPEKLELWNRYYSFDQQ
jgi:hypothetical protein